MFADELIFLYKESSLLSKNRISVQRKIMHAASIAQIRKRNIWFPTSCQITERSKFHEIFRLEWFFCVLKVKYIGNFLFHQWKTHVKNSCSKEEAETCFAWWNRSVRYVQPIVTHSSITIVPKSNVNPIVCFELFHSDKISQEILFTDNSPLTRQSENVVF